MLPSIFGENLFDDFFTDGFMPIPVWNGRSPLYGKHAKNLMKTDVRETDTGYEVDIDLPGFKNIFKTNMPRCRDTPDGSGKSAPFPKHSRTRPVRQAPCAPSRPPRGGREGRPWPEHAASPVVLPAAFMPELRMFAALPARRPESAPSDTRKLP